ESVCVTEVHKDGAAYKDGRLKEGDVLLVVNEVSLQDLPFSEAIRALREAVSPVKLMVLRENPQKLFTTNEIPTKFITVELRKTSIKEHLGLSFIQRINGRGVFITYVEPGSKAAHQNRKILQGDQILEINGHNVRECNQKDVAKMLLNMDGAIVFLLGRIPSLTSSIQEWTRAKLRSRTSTWSSYSAAAREKLQNPRPSLPIGHQGTNLGFPSSAICLDRTCSSHETSPNSSLRKSRLSVVAEGLTVMENTEEEGLNVIIWKDVTTMDQKTLFYLASELLDFNHLPDFQAGVTTRKYISKFLVLFYKKQLDLQL
ncbi:inaD-like protein, partial [Limulus polyphemus]|uniref:InaD-like protein n=1 Tax=Limulus polyphemus TaxID=6850 RepID=A0ABM1TJM7_LIMPO